MEYPKIITGLHMLKALYEANIVPDKCRRVIIDIPYDDVVTIYYEGLGDERLLNINMIAGLRSAAIEHIKKERVKNKRSESDNGVDSTSQ